MIRLFWLSERWHQAVSPGRNEAIAIATDLVERDVGRAVNTGATFDPIDKDLVRPL
jgi:hypothetical protein